MNDASHFDKCKYMKIEKSRVEVLNDSEELVVAAVRLLNFGAVLCALCDDISKPIFKRASALAQKYAKNASCTEKNVDVIQLAIVQSAATSQIEDAAALWPEKSFSSSGPTHSQK